MIKLLKKITCIYKHLSEYERIKDEYSDCDIGEFVKIYSSQFLGNNKIGSYSHISKTVFGQYTYCSKRCEIYNSHIGDFCSIGPNVLIGYGTHPTIKGKTHPYFYSGYESSSDKNVKFIDNAPVEIGDNVWIGANVMIDNGVTIGNNVIIAAFTFVKKDIPNDVIVGGIPSKLLKEL